MLLPLKADSDSTSGNWLRLSEPFWRRGAAAVGRGFGAEATMGMERFFEAGEGAKAV